MTWEKGRPAVFGLAEAGDCLFPVSCQLNLVAQMIKKLTGYVPHRFLIIHQKNPFLHRLKRRCAGRDDGAVLRNGRQIKTERCSLSGLGRECNGSTMFPDDGVTDGQTESGAFFGPFWL
jgi:hypothetical protein